MLETSLIRTVKWVEDSGIAEKGNPMRQAIKTNEEVQELLEAVYAGSKMDVSDAIGDIFVTIVAQAVLQDLDFTTCVNEVLDTIEARLKNGRMDEHGAFIKESV